jgi:hypothetical protein
MQVGDGGNIPHLTYMHGYKRRMFVENILSIRDAPFAGLSEGNQEPVSVFSRISPHCFNLTFMIREIKIKTQ